MKYAVATLCSALALLLAACGGEPGSQEHLAPERPSNVPAFAWDHGMLVCAEDMPSVHLRAFEFEGVVQSGEIAVPPEGAEAAYSAFALSDPEAQVDLFALDEGKETRIHGTTAAVIDGRERTEAEVLDLSATMRFVALDPFAGRTIRLVWRSAGKAAIAGFRILPRIRPPASRPSILVICSDTHRADFALQGDGPALMPRLNAFASKAVVYDHAYSPASWTLPAMVSIFTGLWPLEHQSGKMPERGASLVNAQPYNSALVSLPEWLAGRGYSTWFLHTNPYLYHSGLFADGFDVAVGAGFAPGPTAARLAGEMIQRLPANQPAFVFIHLMDMHQYKAVQFRQMFPGVAPEYSDRERAREAYGAAARVTDECIGEILDAWDARFPSVSSLVLFTSDHGEHLFDPGHPPLTPEEFKAMGGGMHMSLPLLSHGSSMEDALLHVPLAVRFPPETGMLPGRCAAPVSLTDIFPTIVRLLESAPPETGLPGVPLLPLPDPQAAMERLFFADLQPYGDMLASVRLGDFKLVINHSKGTRTLFDMTRIHTDAGEPGAFAENADMTSRLAAAYEAHRESASKIQLPPRETPGTATGFTRDLEKLGYIE